MITARVMRYRRERWLTPSAEMIVAPRPGGIRGHFGPDLRRFVLMHYHQGQVTVERLVAQVQAIGVSISKRQVMRLLIDGQDDFLAETREVLRAGQETADWVTVDETGACHRGANAVCTQICNDSFAWFGTTGSKSRLNFLDLLRAGHTDYVIYDAALDHMHEHALAGLMIRQLAAHPERRFAEQIAWTRHLEQLSKDSLVRTRMRERTIKPPPLVGGGWGRGCGARKLVQLDPSPQPSPTRGEGASVRRSMRVCHENSLAQGSVIRLRRWVRG